MLKKRIQTRTGDSVEYTCKLENDIHCLACVLDGLDWDDLREVVNIPKSNRRAYSQSVVDMSVSVYSFADIEELKRTVQSISADMVAVKQDNSNLKSEVKLLKKEIKQLRTDCNSEISELRSLVSTNARSVERVCNEKSNGIANIKSELRQIKTDVKNIFDDPSMSFHVKSLDENIAKVGSLEKGLTSLKSVHILSNRTLSCLRVQKIRTLPARNRRE